MGGVGIDIRQRGAASIVESMNQCGVSREGFWRGDIVNGVSLPEPPSIAKRAYARLRADPRACKDGDVHGLG